MLKHALSGLAFAIAAATPGSASAAALFDGTYGVFFDVVADGGFTKTYQFTVDAPGYVSASLTSALVSGLDGITFDSITLNGVELDTVPSTTQQEFALTNVFSSTPIQTLVISGDGHGSFGGTFAFAAAAVPEPASWAMLIGGFGLVGMQLRRRATARILTAAI